MNNIFVLLLICAALTSCSKQDSLTSLPQPTPSELPKPLMVSQGAYAGPDSTFTLSQDQKNALETRAEVIEIVKAHLIASHNITVTTDEARQFAKEIVPNMDGEQFTEMKSMLMAQIQAVEKILSHELTPSQAAEKYMSRWGSPETMAAILSQYQTQEQLDEMKRMFPESFDNAIEKNLAGYREALLNFKAAQILLPNQATDPKKGFSAPDFERAAIQYAKKNLADDEFIKTVDFNEIQ